MPARGTLPVGPFLAWADSHDCELTLAGTAMGVADGSLTRSVHRVRHEQQQMVTLGMVDRLFTATDEPHMLAILYPQDIHSMEDRYCSTCVELVTVGDDRLCPWCETPEDERAGYMSGRPSPAARRARAKELRAQGLGYREIGAALGVAQSTAHSYVNTQAS